MDFDITALETLPAEEEGLLDCSLTCNFTCLFTCFSTQLCKFAGSMTRRAGQRTYGRPGTSSQHNPGTIKERR